MMVTDRVTEAQRNYRSLENLCTEKRIRRNICPLQHGLALEAISTLPLACGLETVIVWLLGNHPAAHGIKIQRRP